MLSNFALRGYSFGGSAHGVVPAFFYRCPGRPRVGWRRHEPAPETSSLETVSSSGESANSQSLGAAARPGEGAIAMGSRAEVLGVRIHLPPAVSQTKCRTTIGRCSLGPEGQEETCEASYIAGSGGTHSIVRDMIGAGFPAALIGKCSTSPMSGRPALRSMARCTSISTRPIFWRSLSRQNPLPSGCSVISLSAATHEFTLTH